MEGGNKGVTVLVCPTGELKVKVSDTTYSTSRMQALMKKNISSKYTVPLPKSMLNLISVIRLGSSTLALPVLTL